MRIGASARAVGIFLAVLAALEIAYTLAFQSAPILALARGTAWITSQSLALLGEAVRLDGTAIYAPEFSIRIAAECTAVTPTIVLAAAITALPSSWGAKARGLLAGAAVLYVVNLVRIVSLYYIGVAAPEQVEFSHLVVWQTALVLTAIGLWLLWARGVRRAMWQKRP